MSLIQKLFINWIKNVKKNSKSGNEALTANIMEKSLKETFTGMKDEIKKHADEDLSPELIDTNKETKDQIAETLRDLLGAGIEDQKNTKSPICPGCGETHTTDDKTIQESVKEGEEIMKKAEESLQIGEKIQNMMKETIKIMKDPNISTEKKIKKINESKEILEKEKSDIQTRIENRKNRFKNTITKTGTLKDLVKDIKDGKVAEISGKIVKIDKSGKNPPKIINIKNKEKTLELLKDLFNETEETTDEDLEDFLKEE